MNLETTVLECGCEVVNDTNGVTTSRYCARHYYEFIEKLGQYAALLREERYEPGEQNMKITKKAIASGDMKITIETDSAHLNMIELALENSIDHYEKRGWHGDELLKENYERMKDILTILTQPR